MKKFLSVIILLASIQAGYSQSQYTKDLQKSDEAIVNPKKQNNPKTWVARGDLMKKIADEPIAKLNRGFDVSQLSLLLKGEKPIETKEISSPDSKQDVYTVLVYDNKEVFTKNNKIEMLKATKTLVDEPLIKAYEAYKKAEELGCDSKTIKQNIENLSTLLQSAAFTEYVLGNFDKSFDYFKTALMCAENPAVATVDTATMYNLGFVAMAKKDYKAAEKYYTDAEKRGYVKGGDIYGSIYAAVKNQGDTVRAAEILMNGYKKYPTNLNILAELINHYLEAKEDPKIILPIIEDAQKAAPQNVSLYYVEGNLYSQLNDDENAEKSYRKAIEIDPKNANSYYALGIMFYNKGVGIQNAASDIVDQKQYEAEIAKANELYRKSIEPLEEAYKNNPKEKAFAEALKSVYFRFREESPEMGAKFEHYKKICEQE